MIVPLRSLMPVWLVALVLPPLPASAQAQVITVAMCTGGTQKITLPAGGSPTGDDSPHDCCRKACHAGSDRRKKATLLGRHCG